MARASHAAVVAEPHARHRDAGRQELGTVEREIGVDLALGERGAERPRVRRARASRRLLRRARFSSAWRRLRRAWVLARAQCRRRTRRRARRRQAVRWRNEGQGASIRLYRPCRPQAGVCADPERAPVASRTRARRRSTWSTRSARVAAVGEVLLFRFRHRPAEDRIAVRKAPEAAHDVAMALEHRAGAVAAQAPTKQHDGSVPVRRCPRSAGRKVEEKLQLRLYPR